MNSWNGTKLRNDQSVNKMLPKFAIIGAQKSATTFIHRCLSDHPEVFMPSGEISYFEDPDYQESSFDEFLDLFADAKQNQLKGIKRPTYLHKPECPVRIKKIIPDVKLIVVLRNPIDRFISAYFHCIKFNFLPVIDYNVPQKLDSELRWYYIT